MTMLIIKIVLAILAAAILLGVWWFESEVHGDDEDIYRSHE